MIKIENLRKTFGEQVIFSGFSTEINDGEFVIISGRSGAGKTTLLNMIGFLEEYDSGRITVDGIELSEKKKQRYYFLNKVGFLFQNFALIENKTVRQNLEIIKPSARSEYDIETALREVGLSDKADKKVYTLSGGEQQRVALARLFLKKCDIILADEPTGSLDKGNAEAVIKLLKELNKKGKTVIIVTHDESIKSTAGARVINLSMTLPNFNRN